MSIQNKVAHEESLTTDSGVNTAIKALGFTLDRAVDRFNQMATKVSVLDDDNCDLRIQVKKYEDEKARYRESMNERNKQFSRNMEYVTKLEKQRADLSAACLQLEEVNKKLTQQLADGAKEMDEMHERNNVLRSEIIQFMQREEVAEEKEVEEAFEADFGSMELAPRPLVRQMTVQSPAVTERIPRVPTVPSPYHLRTSRRVKNLPSL